MRQVPGLVQRLKQAGTMNRWTCVLSLLAMPSYIACTSTGKSNAKDVIFSYIQPHMTRYFQQDYAK